jgi:hypothetical protein
MAKLILIFSFCGIFDLVPFFPAVGFTIFWLVAYSIAKAATEGRLQPNGSRSYEISILTKSGELNRATIVVRPNEVLVSSAGSIIVIPMGDMKRILFEKKENGSGFSFDYGSGSRLIFFHSGLASKPKKIVKAVKAAHSAWQVGNRGSSLAVVEMGLPDTSVVHEAV